MMKQPPVRRSSLVRARVARLLLAAFALAACDGAGVTGPRTMAEGPPQDTKRLSSIVVTDTDMGTKTLNRFTYDAAGRLSRMDFYISELRDGPPVRRTVYVEHTYDGDVLTRTDYFHITPAGTFVNWSRIFYSYDAGGYLTRQRQELAAKDGTIQEFSLTYRYDRQGRLVEHREGENGDRWVYTYAADGSLASTEVRSPTSPTLRYTHQHDRGRNPLYRRVAHLNSIILPLQLPSMELSPTNLTRQETRVDDDPTLVASVTHEYVYDADGRPLRIRQRFVNDIYPESRGTVLFMDFEYEPAG